MKARLLFALLILAMPIASYAQSYSIDELILKLKGGPPPWESARSVDVRNDLLRLLGHDIETYQALSPDQKEGDTEYDPAATKKDEDFSDFLHDVTEGADIAEMYETLRKLMEELDFIKAKAAGSTEENDFEEETEEKDTPDPEEEEDAEKEEPEEEDEEQEEEPEEEEEEPTETSCELKSEPESIIAGDDATLSWTTTNASSAVLVTIGEVALTGIHRVSPNETAGYMLRVKGAGGEDECTVEVVVEEVAEPILELVADPDIVATGEMSTITWSAENVFACSLTGGGFSEEGLTGNKSTAALTEDTTFKLTCVSKAGPASEEVTVIVEEETAMGSLRSLASAAPSWSEFGAHALSLFSWLLVR